MLVKLKVAIDWQGKHHKPGETVDLPERMAKSYVSQGDATAVKEEQKK